MSEALTLISGITSLIAAGYILYILYIGFDNKRHLLRVFQLGLFGLLLVVGVLQIVAVPMANMLGEPPKSYYNLVSVVFLLLCILTIPYFRYHNRKHKIKSH